MHLLAPTRYGDAVDLDQLPVERACRRANVPERVPGLREDEATPPVVDQGDVSGPTRIGGTRGKLDVGDEAGRSRVAHDDLLDREVASVKRRLGGIAGEVDSKRSVESERDALPRVQRQPAAVTALEGAHRRLGQPDARAELSLGQPAPVSRRADGPAESGELLEVEARGLGGQDGTAELRHSVCMVAPGAARRVT